MRDLATLAQVSKDAIHAPLVAGVLERGMSLARAARLRTLQRIRGGVSEQLYAEAVEVLADVGCDPGVDDVRLAGVLAEVLRRCLREKDHDLRNMSVVVVRRSWATWAAPGQVTQAGASITLIVRVVRRPRTIGLDLST